MSNLIIDPHLAIITRHGLGLTVETIETSEESTYSTINDLLHSSLAISQDLRKKGYRVKFIHATA